MKQHTGIYCICLVHVLFSLIARSPIFITVNLLHQLIISKKSSMLFQMYVLVFPLLACLPFKES